MTKRRRPLGSLIQVGRNKFRIRVDKTIGGKRVTRSRTVHGTRRAARLAITELYQDIVQGTIAYGTDPRYGHFFRNWLEETLAPRVTPKTKVDYSNAAELYILPTLADKRLSKISYSQIQRLYNGMVNRGYSPSTVRYVHAVLSGSLTDAVRQQLIPSNPAQAVSLPKLDRRREIHAMTEREAARFIAASRKSIHYALYALLLETGVRPGEAFGLTWQKTSLTERTIFIDTSVSVDSARQPTLKDTKSARGRRKISISQELATILEQHQTRTAHLPNPHNLVFPRIDGTPIYPKNFSKRDFKQTLQRAGLSPKFRLYDLRHTAATILINAGTHIKVVSERLGHASIQLTLDTYAHVHPEIEAEAGRVIAKRIFAAEDIEDPT